MCAQSHILFLKVLFDKKHSKHTQAKYPCQELFKFPQAIIFFLTHPPTFSKFGTESCPPIRKEGGGWYCEGLSIKRAILLTETPWDKLYLSHANSVFRRFLWFAIYSPWNNKKTIDFSSFLTCYWKENQNKVQLIYGCSGRISHKKVINKQFVLKNFLFIALLGNSQVDRYHAN